jgi:hypothetical protein
MSLRTEERAQRRAHRKLLRRRRKAIERKHFSLAARLGIKARRAIQKATNIHRRRVGTFRSDMLDGHPGDVGDQVKRFIALAYKWAELNDAVCTVTATTDGTHAPGSWHYHDPLGWAVDLIFATVAQMEEFQTWVAEKSERGPKDWLELFGPADFYVKNGDRIVGHFPDHGDHVHGAPEPGYRR